MTLGEQAKRTPAQIAAYTLNSFADTIDEQVKSGQEFTAAEIAASARLAAFLLELKGS